MSRSARMRRFPLISALWLACASQACTGSVDNLGPAGGAEGPGAGAGALGGGSPGSGVPGGGAAPGGGTGIGDPGTPNGIGYTTRVAKLTNAQWERSVRDLLRLDQPSQLSEQFTQEPGDKGYETVAAATLTISADAWTRYQTAAETLAAQVTADAAKLAKITPSGSFANDTARGAAFIAEFGARAYRRPLSADEKSSYAALFAQGPALVGGSAFGAGVRLVLEAMLQSPHFLYRVEASVAQGKEQRVFLSGHELAARLSYALAGTTPSDELLKAAAANELADPDGVAKWAGKLLDGPNARETLVSFHAQTFDLEAYGSQDKDPALKFDATALAPVLKEEGKRFLGMVVDQKAGIELLLTSPVAFVNQATAPFYGVSGVTGQELVQRELPAGERAGLFTQLGFLSKNATRSGSDPVHRGLAVLRRLLCDEPDPPPAMFDLPKPMAGLTTREVYERATTCGKGCHDTLINPPGFAFEVFDAVGTLRSSEAGKPIDATGTLTIRDGYTPEEKRANKATSISFDGPVELMEQLVELPRVHECYARNFMKYVLARELDPVERGAGHALGQRSRDSSSMREILLGLVQLDTFRARISDPP
ncbi:MAG TPA: DUF1592 domain-containing protein [Polyangiales bacterium]